MKCIVYGLYSSRDNELRYIGQTVQQISLRLGQYKSHCQRSRTPVHCWFKRETEDGYSVYAKTLRADAVYNETEIEVIASYRNSGARLLNVAAGGKGVLGRRGGGWKRPDASLIHRGNKYRLGKKLSDGHKAAISAAHKNRYFSPAHRSKISAARMGHEVSPESREKISVSLKAFFTPEIKSQLSVLRKGRKMPGAAKAKLSAIMAGKKWSPRDIAKRVASRLANKEKKEQQNAKAPLQLETA